MSFLESLSEIKINIVGQVALAFIVIIIILVIFNYIFSHTKRFIKSYKGTVSLVPDMKNAEQLNKISNNPSDKSFIDLPRSYNEENGIEFSYQFWMLVTNWTIRQGQLKHVFHRGNRVEIDGSTYDFDIPLLNAPGVYLNRFDNELLVCMNTFNSPSRRYITQEIDSEEPSDMVYQEKFQDENELLVVPNIPIDKWVLISIVLDGQLLKVYKNGYVVASKTLNSYPRQNSSPVYINDANGFSGNLSKLKYYNYAISQSEIESYINSGPGSNDCVGDKDVPDYLSNTYIDSL